MKKMIRLAAAVVAGAVLSASPAARAEITFDATGGDAEWRVESDGSWRSGAIGDSQSSWMEFAVTNAPCKVSFKWRTSSERNNDELHCYLDGEELVSAVSGVMGDWTDVAFAATEPGDHTVRFAYTKDGSESRGEDCGWVAEFATSPVETRVLLLDANDGQTEPEEKQVADGCAVGALPTPVWNGEGDRPFCGWFTEAEGGERVTPGTLVSPAWKILYARWLQPADNDDFADAVELTGGEGRAEGSNLGATREANDPLADFSGLVNTVWWKWTADADGEIGFDGQILSPDATWYYSTSIGVYTASSVTNEEGETTVFTPVAEGWSYVTFEAEAGTTYYVEVAGHGTGTVELYWYSGGYRLVTEDGVVTGYRGDLPETLDIPEGVTAIADEAFVECCGIETVNLPSTLRSIGEYAFAWCYALETVNGLTDGVEVDPTAFRGTPYSANLPFRLLIEDGVLVGFEGICPAVVEVPDGVTVIAGYAFDGEDGYPVWVPDGECVSNDCGVAEEWRSRAAGLTTVKLPASVAKIANCAFCCLDNLATVTCANPDIVIEQCAFTDVAQLPSIELEKKGAVQTGWQVTFSANAYVEAVWNAEAGYWQWIDPTNVAYAAGETLTLPAGDLSWLFDSTIVVTNADGSVWRVASYEWGMLYDYCEDEEYEGWRWIPVSGRAVWETVTPDLFEGEQTDAFEGDAQYTGWLRDADGNLVGTVTVKAGKPNKKTKAVKLTATVVMLANGKKQTFTGTATAGQLANVTLSGKSGSMNVTLSDDSVTGTYGAYTIEAAKNVFTSKASDDKANAKSVAKRNWTVTLASAKGYTAFTLAVAAKGKTKVTGVLPDGTKVSVSAQAVVGDGGRWAVPVMFAKKSKFGFVAWFDANGFSLVSDLTPLKGPKGAVTEWEPVPDACGPVGSLAAGAHPLAVDAASVKALLPAVNAELLPTAEEVKVAGNKWTLAKAAKVAYKGGAWTVTPGAKGGAVANASGAKLTFTPKTGTFKGSFTAYSVKRGKLAKTKFTVNGAVVNGVAYGTAFNKTAGSVPLTVQ